MSRREPDLETGIERRAPSEKESAATTGSERGNSYPPTALQPDAELDPPYLQELREAIICLEQAHNPDAVVPGRKNTKKPEVTFFGWVKRRSPPVRYTIYLAPLLVLLVIPIAVLSTVFSGSAFIKTGNGETDSSSPPKPLSDLGIHAAGLFVWLEIATLGLWAAMILAWLSIFSFNKTCDLLRERLKSRQLLLDALKNISSNLMALPITLVLWTIICFATTPAICVFNKGDTQCIQTSGWIYYLTRAFEAGIVVSFILWVERLLIGMSFISYYGKQYDHKHAVLQSDIEHVRNLFYLTLHRPPKHKHRLHGPASTCQDCKQAHTLTCLSSWESDWNDVFKTALRREETSEYLAIYLWFAIKLDITVLSNTTEDEAIAKLKEDILTPQFKEWICHDREKFAPHVKQKLFQYEEDAYGDDATVRDYTDILNGDNDNDIAKDEMLTAIKRLGRRAETLEKTLHNVREAMESLDRPLSVVVLIAVAFIYGEQVVQKLYPTLTKFLLAAFFVNNFNTYATAIFTAFTGLGFALSGTVTDFLGSCIFLFVKHPYYVGDRIEINHIQLYVDRIALMTTRFSRVDNNKFVQLPHSLLNTYWIENLSRSKRLKEYFTIAVSADTSFDTIDKIRSDLQDFVRRNARDFKEGSVDIQLSSMTDLTQLKLDVEVEHKVRPPKPLLPHIFRPRLANPSLPTVQVPRRRRARGPPDPLQEGPPDLPARQGHLASEHRSHRARRPGQADAHAHVQRR